MVTVEVPAEYGYVVLTVFFFNFVVAWMAANVGKARKKYDVQYPTMYSDKDKMFNCVQRVHQNTLENISQFFFFMLIGGLQHPIVTSIGGVIYTLGRIAYGLGYYSGDPEKRMNGVFGYLGLFAIMGTTISFAIHVLGWL